MIILVYGLFQRTQKIFIEIGGIYFWAATINSWYKLKSEDASLIDFADTNQGGGQIEYDIYHIGQIALALKNA